MRTLGRKKLRARKLQDQLVEVQDKQVQRSLLRLECLKIAANQAKSNLQNLNKKRINLNKKPSASLLLAISRTNRSLDLAVEQFQNENFNLYHYQ